MTIGQRIKTIREIVGITKTDLGKACGYDALVGKRAVQRWEADECSPSVKQLWPICHCLGITLDTLIPDPDGNSDIKDQLVLAGEMTGKPLELLYIEEQEE